MSVHVRDRRIELGATYRDASAGDTFTVVSVAERDSVDLDSGQWYELDGPEGLLAKVDAGVVRRVESSPAGRDV